MEIDKQLEATCPECRGPLQEVGSPQPDGNKPKEFRCLVGHMYSPAGLLEAHYETQETTLWSAVVALEETATLVDAAATEFPPEVRQILEGQVRRKLEQAAIIRKIIDELESFSTS